MRLGVLVCTELWFLEHARAYGRAGAHLVVTPRVTPATSHGTWLAGGRTCAVVSGAWSLSSSSAEPEHGGLGWAIDPEGVVVATTEAAESLGLNLNGARVVVQGFGNVGSIAAKILEQSGAKIVGVSDAVGGIHNPHGLPIAELV